MLSPLPLVAIVGPTGSAKSALALKIAEHFSGEIVNCDSLQLYRGFDLGTAKTPQAARRSIPHHLIDVLDPGSVYSAGDYARCARSVLAAISARHRLPIVVGGTGFYLRALLEGLPALPSRDVGLRGRLKDRESRRPGSVYRILRRLDPAAAARIHAGDLQKSIRALEVRLLSGNPAPPQYAGEPLSGYRTLKIGLQPDRARLNAALDARTREMFHSGLVEEVERLLASGCSGAEKPFESLGYKQALAVVRGAMSIDQAIASSQLETRQYAKRQMTWFRRDHEIHWLHGFGAEVVGQAIEMVREWMRPLLH
ncbi:MAG TPA: tRNA (adenosine(37)-N6)-dimethylallyltransferase MiaA [Bryobacteraceae bacterium]|nr:tRNA (adenosine(37)-N6)-dimethylallyltransferase MiaA [Bryobacteraceae bacterium]